MSSLALYLLVINVVAFVVFAIDYLLCIRDPEIDETVANALILDLFLVAGGAVGGILALFIFAGIGRGHRMNKDNIAWWFLAIICLVIWAAIVLTNAQVIQFDFSPEGILHGWDGFKLGILGIYLIAINVVTLIAFVADKAASTDYDFSSRKPEALLLGLCLIGGSVGGILAMSVVRHKTRKWYFVWGLPVFIVLDALAIFYAHASGLL